MARHTQGEDFYTLGRDSDASSRLSGQHFILTTRNGWLVHPRLQPLAKTPGVKIADIATGNGIWASQVAIEYPDAQVTGLDISDRQYPPRWTCPKNLTLGVYNVLQPPPENLLEHFDIVHVRLLAPGMRDINDFRRSIENFHKLLKPGGYLQWHEILYPGWRRVDRSLLVLDTDHLPTFIEPLDQALDGRISSRQHRLEDLVAHDGIFVDVQRQLPPVRPWLLGYETTYTARALAEMIQNNTRKVLLDGNDETTDPDTRERKLALLNDARRLMDEYLKHGDMIAFSMHLITARKFGK